MMKDIFNKASSPFFKFGQLMNLKRIAKEYWIPYIVENFQKTGKSISEEQAECLCERVKYNSWYVQQYCFFLWSHTEKAVTQKLLDDQLQLVLDTNEDLFLTEMDELTPLVEKDLVEKRQNDFSFVDPVFELWLKREYNIR